MDMRPGSGGSAGRRVRRRIVVLAVVAATVSTMLGCAHASPGRPTAAATDVTTTPTVAMTTPAMETTPPLETTAPPTTAPATRTTAPKPTRTASRVAVVPSKKVVTDAPPPDVPHGQAPDCTPTFTGTAAPKATVRAALESAADTHFWPNSAPTIVLPRALMYAVAWQESGWQSNIVACDGGIGTMQVMPTTVTMINNRFGKSYDVHTVTGNTMLGAGLLEWLVKWMGDTYYGSNYDLSLPAVPGGLSLLDSVIVGYNLGFGGFDATKGVAGLNAKGKAYLSSVKALMASCPCLA